MPSLEENSRACRMFIKYEQHLELLQGVVPVQVHRAFADHPDKVGIHNMA